MVPAPPNLPDNDPAMDEMWNEAVNEIMAIDPGRSPVLKLARPL